MGAGKGAGAWAWTPVRESVAVALAVGKKTVEVIADEHDVGVATVQRWRATPEMQARIGELQQSFREHVSKLGIAEVSARVQRRHDFWERAKGVIEERAAAAAESMPDVPGAKSGLIVERKKGVGKRIVVEHVIDTDILQEIARLENDTARDLGQHIERREVSGPGGGPIRIDAAVTVGYQNGALRDILDEFLTLIARGDVPEDVKAARVAVQAAAAARNTDEGAQGVVRVTSGASA